MLSIRRPDATSCSAFPPSLLKGWRRLACLAISLTLSASLQNSSSAADGKSTRKLRAQALEYVNAGNIQQAIVTYDTAIKAASIEFGKESTYVGELYFEEGNLARKNGAAELAKKCYEKAVNYRPADVSARVQLAELERNTGNTRGAFDNARLAYAINPNLAISRKELSLCLQLSGRPSEASQIAATLARTSKNAPALPKASKFKVVATPIQSGSQAETKQTDSNANSNGPVITSTTAGANSALHWSHKNPLDEAAKKAKEQAAAIEAKLKAEEAAKALEKKKDEEEAAKKAKQKQKKEDGKKSTKDKSSKDKAGKDKQSKGNTQQFVEPEAATASLKTSATTLPKPGEKSKVEKSEKQDEKAEKTDKAEKTASKSHLNVGAVTDKSEKPQAEKHDSGLSENEPAKPKNPPIEKAAPAAVPPVAPLVPISIPVNSGKPSKPHLGKGGLVPPPPPTPVVIPGGMVMPVQPPPVAPPAPAAKSKPKAKPPTSDKADKPEKAEKSDKTEESSTAKPHDEDPDFLINWGGADKKKKAK